jgi:hypothetical protein
MTNERIFVLKLLATLLTLEIISQRLMVVFFVLILFRLFLVLLTFVLQNVPTEFINFFAVEAWEQVMDILCVMFGLKVCMERLEFRKVQATPRTVVFIDTRVFVILDVVTISVTGA